MCMNSYPPTFKLINKRKNLAELVYFIKLYSKINVTNTFINNSTRKHAKLAVYYNCKVTINMPKHHAHKEKTFGK